MIEEQARVVRLHGDSAEVVTQRQSACGSCAAKSGCGTSLLAAWFPQRRLSFWLKNDIGAGPGDQVILGLDEAMLQRGSLLLYALPLAGLLLGAIIGERAFVLIALPSELGAIISGLLGLTAALVFVRHQTVHKTAGGAGGVKLLRVTRRPTIIAPGAIEIAGAHQPEDFRN